MSDNTSRTEWRPISEMTVEQKHTRPWWLGAKDAAEPAYWEGGWINLYSEIPLKWTPTHFQSMLEPPHE